MAVNGHDDTFVINDIRLNIPPTEIHISKNAANHIWQTLRTRNAQKVKSGHGTIDINFQVAFVGENEINTKLLPLIAQLKLTPICYVENSHLRQSIYNTEDSNKNMALILKSMAITVRPELKDTWVVNFDFGWFNYDPFIKDFRFKQDIFVPIQVRTPEESLAWKKFYQADLPRYSPIIDPRSVATFLYEEFEVGPRLSEDEHKENPKGRRDIENDLQELLKNAHLDLNKAVKENKDLNEVLRLKEKVKDVDGRLNSFQGLKAGDFVPTGVEYPTGKGESLQLYSRAKQLTAERGKDLTITGITVVMENIVAALPIIGHQYVTYQHIGSIDPRVIIKVMATSDQARRRVNEMWNTLEKTAIKFRHIPQQFLNVKIINDVLNATIPSTKSTSNETVRSFITDSITDDTIPGQPGTYGMTLMFRATDNTFQEEIVQEFITEDQVRDEIIKQLVKRTKTTNFITRRNGEVKWDKIRVVPNFARSAGREAFFDIVEKFAELVEAEVKETGQLLLLPRFFQIIRLQQVESDKKIVELGPIIDSIHQVLRNSSPTRDSHVRRFADNRFGETGTLDAFQAQNLFEQFDLIQGIIGAEKLYNEAEGSFIANINDYRRDVADIADSIVLDSRIDLPEFARAKELVDQQGTFKGKSAYTDFVNLPILAALEGVSELELEPDLYFFNNSLDRIGSILDPAYFVAAERYAKSLYSREVDSERKDGKGGFVQKIDDWVNGSADYVQRSYIDSLGTPLKNRFEKDWEVTLDPEKQKEQGAEALNMDARFIDNDTPNICRESVINQSWTNSLAPGNEVNKYLPRGYYRSNEPPLGTDETAFVQSAGQITHYGEFEKVFDQTADIATRARNAIGAFAQFTRPLAGNPRISGKFHTIRPTLDGGIRFHKGIDYAIVSGTPVLATATGKILRIGIENSNRPNSQGYGQRIWIAHDEPRGFTSVYAHLSQMNNPKTNKQWNVGDKVQQGQLIGLSGGGPKDFGRGSSRGAHLHFEIRDASHVEQDPEFLFKFSLPRDTSRGTGFKFGDSIFHRSIESFEESMVGGQALRMNRAYPTFKLYFIEEDALGERRFGFDDFFSYNSVKSIRLIRSRKIPSDLAVIELTNVSGVLSNRKFRQEKDPTKPRGPGGKIAEESASRLLDVNTERENPIASMMLQEGIKIELRLGYANDPNKLDVPFVGQIVEVEFNETDDLVTIICQSYATELTQNIKGLKPLSKKNGWIFNPRDAATSNLLSDMMQQPEVIHFGRWKRSKSIGGPTNTNRDVLSNKFEWHPRPQDDNIFAPDVLHLSAHGWIKTGLLQGAKDVVTLGGAVFGREAEAALADGRDVGTFRKVLAGIVPAVVPLRYYIYKTTIWDIFKEMELRHPECIGSPVPYKDRLLGNRMTMFFGIPNQLYFARDPSFKEQRENDVLKRTINDNIENLETVFDKIADVYGLDRISDVDKRLIKQNTSGIRKQLTSEKLGVRFFQGIGIAGKIKDLRDTYLDHRKKNLAIKNRAIKPFRDYHFVTSQHHIVRNDIRASSLDVYNTISVGYFNGPKLFESDKSEFEDRLASIQGVKPPQDVFRLKVNAALPDEEVQEAFIQYPSCEGKTQAKFYAMGSLKRSLKEIYKGELVVLGNPKIKPYDIVYVYDEYTDMVGPIEVESVCHTFSQESGFITSIVPDMCVTINEWTTLATMDAMGVVVEAAYKDVYKAGIRARDALAENIGDTGAQGVTLGVSAALISMGIGHSPFLAPSALIGAFALYKLTEISQFRNPFTFSPLMYKGRPMIAGMADRATNPNWIQNAGKWFKDGAEGISLVIEDIADKLYIVESRGDLLSGFRGSTKGPTF